MESGEVSIDLKTVFQTAPQSAGQVSHTDDTNS